MKISAVIPVFNTNSKFLRECIDSVLNQTYEVAEIIIIDDGSDRSETLDELFRTTSINDDRNIKVIHQTNRSIPGALNTGIRHMAGDWYTGCASDDRWLPNKIEEQVKFIKAHPEAKVVYSDWEFMDIDGFRLKTYQEPGFKNRFEAGHHLIREFFGNWSGLMIHKSVFDDVGLYNEEFSTREDYEFVVRILTKHMMYRIPKVLFQYRLHDEQVSRSSHLGTRSDDSRRLCEAARDLAIEYFGNEEDRKEFPSGREYRWGK